MPDPSRYTVYLPFVYPDRKLRYIICGSAINKRYINRMKPDLRGVNQWGTGKYSDLRKQRELKDKRRPGEAAREALTAKKSKHRYLVTLNPELAEFARVFGQGKISSGINQIIHMAKMSGATPLSEFIKGDVYETLNVRLSKLENEVRLLAALGTRKKRSRKKRIEFPPSTTTED